jgi:hypothetical protein
MAKVKVEVFYHPDANKAEVDRLIAAEGFDLCFDVEYHRSAHGVARAIRRLDGSALCCMDKVQAEERGIKGDGKAIILTSSWLAPQDKLNDAGYVIVGYPRTLFTEDNPQAEVKVVVFYHQDADKAEVDRLIALEGLDLCRDVDNHRSAYGVGKAIRLLDGSFLCCMDKVRADEEGMKGDGKAIILVDQNARPKDAEYVIVGHPRALFTEADWLTCNDTQPLVELLRGRTSDRKLRLFVCESLRQVSMYQKKPRGPWEHEIVPQWTLEVVEVAERFADGKATKEELAKSRSSRGDTEGWNVYVRKLFAPLAAARAADDVMDPESVWYPALGLLENWYERGSVVRYINGTGSGARFIHDIFNNAFRTVTLNPAWLTRDVVGIAQRIYDDRRFEDMPILGDALEDTGCDNASILEHCRSGSEHVRGCWVVDLVLGME